MDVYLHILILLTLGALAAAVFVLWQRLGTAELRLRLLNARHDELRKAARAFIGASRQSPMDVCMTLDGCVRALVPGVDTVLFLERAGGDLACVYATGGRAEYFRGAHLSLERDASALTVAAIECRRVASTPLQKGAIPGDKAFLAVPMVDDGQCTAVFYAAGSTVTALEPEDDLVTLVDLATPAYRVAVERESDRQKATVDSLTGLLTPRAFRSHLADAIALAHVHDDVRLSLLYIDTDHFKACNDSLGHAAGDTVLRTVARMFATVAGPEAMLARNGGDEFCILFSGGTKSDAIRRAERIRQSVASYPFETLLGASLKSAITISVGVASYPLEAKTWEELIERADEAMYHSKKNGRNRVSFFGIAGNIVDLSDPNAGYAPGSSAFSAFRAEGD